MAGFNPAQARDYNRMKDLVIYVMKSTSPIKWKEWGRVSSNFEILGPEDFQQAIQDKLKQWGIKLDSKAALEKLQLLMGGTYSKGRFE